MWWITVPAVLAGLLTFQNLRQPSLGLQQGRLAPLGRKPNGVSTQTEDARKHVPSLQLSKPLDKEATFAEIRNVIAKMSGAKILEEESHYLRVIFRTPLMRFRDDVEVLLDSEENRLHFRSQSRAGYSDMGVNRKRYQDFAKRLKTAGLVEH